MDLKFQVNRQHIARVDHAHVVAGSRNFIGCIFAFGPEWDGIVKTAIFRKGETVYHVVLSEDAIASGDMPVFSAGIWQVSVFGGDLMTADSAPFLVCESGYSDGTAPAAPSSTVYEALSSMVAGAVNKTEALEAEFDALETGTPVCVTGETLFLN